MEHRSGRRDQMRNLAAEFVGLQVDIIVANGAEETHAARNTTQRGVRIPMDSYNRRVPTCV